MRRTFCLMTICAVALTACDQNVAGRVSTLESESQALRDQIAALDTRLGDAETKVWVLETSKNPYESAVFDPAAATAFQRLDTTVGPLAISIEDVKSHADGVKVRLNVGNVTSATFSGGLFKIKWGSRFEKGANYMEWQKARRETEHKFTNDLRPATWNQVTLTLPGLPPDKFGYLELSVETDQIKLYESKR